MNICIRLWRSVLDGTFPIKVLNRVSRTKYVPSPEAAIERYLVEHFPERDWRKLPPVARQMWVDLSPVFVKANIAEIAYVGAYDGEMALAMDHAFPGRHFYLIEPVPSTFQTLAKNVSGRPDMKCFNLAAGAKEESMDMFVDSFAPASSLLPYEERAIQEFPFLGDQKIVKVQVKPLDHILQEGGAGNIDLLIMDVQGYEDIVIQGGQKTLQSCKVVVTELSLQALYTGSSTFDSVYQVLTREGFALQYLFNPLKGASQTIVQIDGVFVRA